MGEQAEKWERTSQWVEQAGKGASGKLDASPHLPERAPAETHLDQLRFYMATKRGRARSHLGETVLVSACPLPSLFDPLRRP